MRSFYRALLIVLLPGLLLLMITAAASAGTDATGEILVKPARLRQFLEDYIEQHRAELPPAKISFRELHLPKPFNVPAGELTCEITPSDPQILTSRRFNLILRVDGRVVENLAVRGTLEALAEVAVAADDLRRGVVIDAQDIRIAELDLNSLRSPCFDMDELVGKRLKRGLRAGEAFERASVVFPPLIKRGEPVTITASKGALTVTARGMAQQDGQEGDMIRVRNISSNKDILCRITGSESVAVEF